MSRARIGLLFGGTSAEREVSLRSGKAVAAAMTRMGLDFVELDGIPALQQALASEQIAQVFNLLHGGAGENGLLQGYLGVNGVAVTGAGVLGCALSMDKARCKAVWAAAGIPVARHQLLEEGTEVDALVQTLGLPLVVKPVHEGSSVGISIVRQVSDLAEAMAQARRFDQAVMIEQFVAGSEYTAAMVDGEMLPLVRVETPRDFYDYQAKYQSDSTLYHCPAGLSREREAELLGRCAEAFAAVAVDGWGRVDFILNQQGEPVFLEVNTAPGMTDHSLVPMAARQHGWSFEQLVSRILATAKEVRQ